MDFDPSNPMEFLKENPEVVFAIILLPIFVAAILFALMKISEIREERAKKREWEAFYGSEDGSDEPEDTALEDSRFKKETDFPKPKSEKELSLEDLKSREERLRAREEKLKRRKITELEDKKLSVERKHVTGIVKEERKVTDAIEERRERELKTEDLRNNRQRLVKLIELAEDRYKDGLMSEKNFRTIMQGYQKELVETDVEMTKLRGYDI